jgi:hypothetical protein
MNPMAASLTSYPQAMTREMSAPNGTNKLWEFAVFLAQNTERAEKPERSHVARGSTEKEHFAVKTAEPVTQRGPEFVI